MKTALGLPSGKASFSGASPTVSNMRVSSPGVICSVWRGFGLSDEVEELLESVGRGQGCAKPTTPHGREINTQLRIARDPWTPDLHGHRLFCSYISVSLCYMYVYG
jgi:hypothetical protein